MPLCFDVIPLVLEDSLEALPGEVEDMDGCSSKNGCMVIKIPLSKWDVRRRQLPPLIGELVMISLVPPGLQLSYQLAQSLHTKTVLEDLVHIHAEEEVDLMLYVGQDVVPNGLHAHHADVLPPLLRLDLKHLQRVQRTQVYGGHSGGIVHHDIKYDPVANHEVPVSRVQKIFQVVLNVPETERNTLNHVPLHSGALDVTFRRGLCSVFYLYFNTRA